MGSDIPTPAHGDATRPTQHSETNRPIRVLHVLADTIDGGAQWMVASIIPRLSTRFDSTVVSLRGPRFSSVEEVLRRHGVPIVFLEKQDGFDRRLVFRFRRVMKQIRPAVVHTHRIALRYVLLSIPRKAKQVVHTVHSAPDTGSSRLGRVFLRSGAHLGMGMVAVGESVRQSVRSTCGGRFPVDLVPNGIPIAALPAAAEVRRRMRADLGVEEGCLVFVCVARLNYPKNQRLLVEAFASDDLLRQRGRVLFVGDGPHRDMLLGLTREAGVENRIRFLGQRSDVREILEAADVFVLTSEWEGNPLSVMEALAAGRPVLSSRVGSVGELVDEGETGYLFDPGDAAQLAGLMRQAVEHPDRFARMGVTAARVAPLRFGIDQMVSAYEGLYLARAFLHE